MKITGRMRRGFFYTLASGYTARLCSVALTFLIRRELGPHVFADAVLGITIFMLLSSLREFGLPHALLHFQDHVEEFVGTHFILNTALTAASALVTCGVVMALGAQWPDSVSSTTVAVVCALSAIHFGRNLSLTSESLLRRDFEFGRLGLLHGMGTILALGGALVAARAGWGEWSLILGGWSTFSVFSIIYGLFFSVGVWWARPIRWRASGFSRLWAGRLLSYGVWIWIGWILQALALWFDKLAVWLVAGAEEVALYENAWWLVQLPTAIISSIIFNYTNTLYSRCQTDREKLSEAFSHMTGLIVRVSSPLALVLVSSAGTIVAVIIPEWGGSVPIIVSLAAFAFLRPLLDDGFGLLWAVGDTRGGARIMAWRAAATVILVPSGAALWGVNGVALAMGFASLVGVVGLAIGVRAHVGVPWRELLLGPGVALTIACGAAAVHAQSVPVTSAVSLAVRIGLILLTYGAVLAAIDRQHLRGMLAQIRLALTPDDTRERRLP